MRLRNIYSSKMNKRGQFFILSAVIIASIIVSLASVKNFVSTGDAPKKFYYYSQQLEDEAGAVVDYALYNDPTGTDTNIKKNLNNFLQQSIEKTLEGYPTMEIFSCYSNVSSSGYLICQNNGTRSVRVNTSSSNVVLSGSVERVCAVLWGVITCNPTLGSIDIRVGRIVTVTPNGSKSYNIDIQDSSVQRGQFYFLLKMNTSSGDYVASSAGK